MKHTIHWQSKQWGGLIYHWIEPYFRTPKWVPGVVLGLVMISIVLLVG